MTCSAPKRNRKAWFQLLVAGLITAPAAQALTITEALRLSQTHDPLVASSQATYEADREAGRQERGSLYPTLGVTGTGTYADTKSEGVFGNTQDTYPAWSAGVQLSQPLFRLDWFARGDRATASDDLAEAGLSDRRQQQMSRIAERYFGVLVAQDELALAEADAKAVRESLDNTRKRYEVELVPGMDLKEAQARDDLSQAALLSARRSLEAAQDALDESTGKGYDGLPPLRGDISFPPLQPAEADSWIKSTREQSPTIRTAQRQVDVAKANVRSRKSEAAPALDLVASATHDDTSKFQFGQKQDDQRVGVQLSVPIYAGGINTSRVREADARVRNAESELQRITAESERRTRQLFRDVQTGYIQDRAYTQALTSAEAAAAATGYGYDAGTRTITDVLDAKSRVVQARRDLNQTRYNLLLNLLQLKQSAGALSEQDFVQIDQLLQPAN